MQIEVKVREIYGNRTVYPHCTKAKLFAKIAGTTTLTRAAIDDIKKLGYEFIVITDKEANHV